MKKGLFDFFRKNDIVGLSDREKYGYAWLKIVSQKNREKGLQVMKELSDNGFVEGSIALAMFTENASERMALYKKAADQNHPEGLWGYSGFLDHSYIPDPDDPDDAKWEAYCLKAAQHGSVDAMNELGNVFNRRNQYPQSMYWYAMANANDFPNGQISMNGIARKWYNDDMPYDYEETDGFTEAKYKCAMFYLEMWADQEITTPIDEYISLNLAGEPLAAYLTGDMFESAGNMEMAYRMYNAIAHENDAHGLKCYADMLFTGRGVQKDMQGALRMYQLSAEKGDRAAMFVVGEFTKNQNANLAAYWYGVAHSRGYQHALQRMIQLASK
jgi:TPR repeat protein